MDRELTVVFVSSDVWVKTRGVQSVPSAGSPSVSLQGEISRAVDLKTPKSGILRAVIPAESLKHLSAA